MLPNESRDSSPPPRPSGDASMPSNNARRSQLHDYHHATVQAPIPSARPAASVAEFDLMGSLLLTVVKCLMLVAVANALLGGTVDWLAAGRQGDLGHTSALWWPWRRIASTEKGALPGEAGGQKVLADRHCQACAEMHHKPILTTELSVLTGNLSLYLLQVGRLKSEVGVPPVLIRGLVKRGDPDLLLGRADQQTESLVTMATALDKVGAVNDCSRVEIAALKNLQISTAAAKAEAWRTTIRLINTGVTVSWDCMAALRSYTALPLSPAVSPSLSPLSGSGNRDYLLPIDDGRLFPLRSVGLGDEQICSDDLPMTEDLDFVTQPTPMLLLLGVFASPARPDGRFDCSLKLEIFQCPRSMPFASDTSSTNSDAESDSHINAFARLQAAAEANTESYETLSRRLSLLPLEATSGDNSEAYTSAGGRRTSANDNKRRSANHGARRGSQDQTTGDVRTSVSNGESSSFVELVFDVLAQVLL